MEALLTYCQRSPNLVKLGMNITEPHFANEISRAIMKNNDAARQARRITAELLAKEAEEEAARERARLAAEEEEERRKEEEKLAKIAEGGSIPSNSGSDSDSADDEVDDEDDDEDEDEEEDEGDAEEGKEGECSKAALLSATTPDTDGEGVASAAAAEAIAASALSAGAFDPPARAATSAEAMELAAPA